jgi:hypothetical protein
MGIKTRKKLKRLSFRGILYALTIESSKNSSIDISRKVSISRPFRLWWD